MKKVVAVLGVALLSGCMSTSEVQQVDRDTYVVSSSTGAGAIDNQELMIASAQKATEFCAKSGLEMVRAEGLLSHKGFGKREMMFNFRCIER
ncbi:MAG TPA: hypothetical protein VIP51_05505 [Eoetvoesiella sp.]